MIERLRLKGFRRYEDAIFALGPGLNVIEGPNNAGKSTLFLAIEYAFFGRVGGHAAFAGLLHPKARGLGVELVFRGKDGARYLLQRAHVRPPRAKTNLVGHFTLKRLREGEEPERYLASSDFSDSEEALALTLNGLTGMSRRTFEHVVHLRQGEIPSILEGAPLLDVVLGVTAAVLASDEMRALALEHEKRAAALPVLASAVARAERERASRLETSAALHREHADRVERRAALEAELARAEDEHARLAPALDAGDRLAEAEAELASADRAARAAAARQDELGVHDRGALEEERSSLARERAEVDARWEELTAERAELDRRLGDLEGQLARRDELPSGEGARCESCGQAIDPAHVEAERRRLAVEVERSRARATENAAAQSELAARRQAVERKDARTSAMIVRLEEALSEARARESEREAATSALARVAADTLEHARAVAPDAALEAGDLRGLHTRVRALLGEAAIHARERRAEAKATLSALDRELAGIVERRARAEDELRALEREHAGALAELGKLETSARLATQLRALSGGFKSLQRALRERACEALASETLRFHALLSGREGELTALRIDPERYRVEVVPADIGREVPAHLFQGGGHRLLLGLALRMALAKRVGPFPFLLLDEPTYGLDAELRSSLLARLRELGASEQLLVITHHRVEAEVERRVRIERRGHASLAAEEAG